MTEKQINKWLRRRFTVVGWGLIGFNLLLNLLTSLSMGLDLLTQALPSLLRRQFPEVDMGAAANNAWGYILSPLVAVMIVHVWKGPDYFHREILAKQQPMTGRVFFCLLSLTVGAQMISTLWLTALEGAMNCFGRSVLPMLESVSGATDTFSMFLYASIAAPIGEELIFRGYVLRSLRPYGKRFAVFASALLFGLFHGNLLQGPYAFLVGLVLGYVTVEYSIHWAIAIHMFNNLVLADLLTRITLHWSDTAVGILNLTLFGGFFLMSAAILLKNRRAIRAYQKSEWMDRRVLKCFFLNSGIGLLTVIMLINMLSMLLL